MIWGPTKTVEKNEGVERRRRKVSGNVNSPQRKLSVLSTEGTVQLLGATMVSVSTMSLKKLFSPRGQDSSFLITDILLHIQTSLGKQRSI